MSEPPVDECEEESKSLALNRPHSDLSLLEKQPSDKEMNHILYGNIPKPDYKIIDNTFVSNFNIDRSPYKMIKAISSQKQGNKEVSKHFFFPKAL